MGDMIMAVTLFVIFTIAVYMLLKLYNNWQYHRQISKIIDEIDESLEKMDE